MLIRLLFSFIIIFHALSANSQDIYELSGRSEIKTYAVDDNKELAFRYYPADAESRQNIVYLHGIESHSGWFDKAALKLNTLGYNVYALDRRGSGLNRENRGFVSGHVDEYETLFDDIDHFLDSQSFTKKPLVIGLSWGGKLALSYNMARPEKIEALVLITPGLVSLVDVSFIEKIKIFTLSIFSSTSQFALPIQPEMFTTTPFYLNYIKQDPLRNTTASAEFLMQSRALDGFVDDNITSHSLPTLLFLAGQDQIIDNVKVTAILELNAADNAPLTIVEYPEQTHSIQFDATDTMVEDIDKWFSGKYK